MTSPARLFASRSTTGAASRQGPHHGAHTSTRTGTGEAATARSSSKASTSCGVPETSRRALHWPQMGFCDTRFSGTRFSAPHWAQRNVCMVCGNLGTISARSMAAGTTAMDGPRSERDGTGKLRGAAAALTVTPQKNEHLASAHQRIRRRAREERISGSEPKVTPTCAPRVPVSTRVSSRRTRTAWRRERPRPRRRVGLPPIRGANALRRPARSP